MGDDGQTNQKRRKTVSTMYSPFEIPFNPEPLRTPRKLRIVCIGAGFAGLTLAYKIHYEKKLGDIIDFQIYERQHDVGGTWLINRYPGLACDVPIHIYTLPWAPKSDWKRYFAEGPEIIQYIREVNQKFQLDRWIKFNSNLEEALWDESKEKWKLRVLASEGLLEDECDILVGAVGTQNTPVKSAVPGLENFLGQVTHTGNWDDNIDAHGKRVAVIGNGSSGVQCFTALQQKASQITHYIRSPTWISLNYMSQFTRNGNGQNFDYTDEEKAAFQDPRNLLSYRQELERASNGIFKGLVFNETGKEIKKKFHTGLQKVMRDRLKDSPDLADKLIPNYQPWCRRLTPADGYLEALQLPNAHLTMDPIAEVTANGIRTQSGEETEFDIIVAATGFVNSRCVPWRMIGRNGVDLADRFELDADGYMSVAAPDMPNYFSVGCGPNFTIANGPVLSAMGFISDYILQWAQKMAEEDIASVCVKSDVVEAFNIYIQQVLRRTAWNAECESWYKKGRRDEYRTGITAIYPGSMMHFKTMLEKIRPEDFNIKYRSANPFKFYGCGLTALDLSSDAPDLSYYLADTMRMENLMDGDLIGSSRQIDAVQTLASASLNECEASMYIATGVYNIESASQRLLSNLSPISPTRGWWMPRLPPWAATLPPPGREDWDHVEEGDVYRWHTQRRGGRLYVWATSHRYRFVRMLCGLVVTLFLSALSLSAARPSPHVPLRFTPNGTFQISIFEDLHFGENAWDQWGPQQDINSIKVMNEVLDAETQQLVVLNGDLITGENTYKFNSTDYVDEIVGPLVQRGLTWASTYGNHDSAFNLSRELMLRREHTYSNARTKQMVFGKEAGVTNYYLPVYPSSGSNVPALLLWFFDSRGGNYYQQVNASGDLVGQPDWVDQSVVNWFQQTNAELTSKYGGSIPSLAFVHIPTNASQAFQTEIGWHNHTQPGINDDYILAGQAQGWCEDGSNDPTCVYGGQDVPFMQAVTTTPGLMALFSGHDHGDTWCYKWNGVIPSMTIAGNGLNLCFGQHSGYGGYGTWIRGSRQVLITESLLANKSIDTWIRLEDSSVVGAVTLNSTYNHNYYPATPDVHTYCPTCNYTIITPMPGT